MHTRGASCFAVFCSVFTLGACSDDPIEGKYVSSGSSGASGTIGINGSTGAGSGAVVGGTRGSIIVIGGGGSAAISGGNGAVTVAGGSAAAAVGGTVGQAGSSGNTGSNTNGECGKNLLPLPEDPSERGPWDVSLKTVKIGRMTVEVLFPAKPGSSAGATDASYDPLDWLPESEKAKIPPEESTKAKALGGHAYRDLPIDDEHGPYPVIIFIHGTCSFRVASASTNVHWASRGFVVLTADYPGLGLNDQICQGCGCPITGMQDVPGDVNTQLDALNNLTGDLAFLAGHIDMTRLGISGHSQGGCVSATLAELPNVQIVIPLDSATATVESSSLKSVMYIGGLADAVMGYEDIGLGNLVCPNFAISQVAGYEGSPGQPKVIKRMVGITGGGHLVPTDLCQKGATGLTINEIITKHEICGSGVNGQPGAAFIGLSVLLDCGTIAMDEGIKAVNYASTAALEETLHCKDRTAAFNNMKTAVPQIGDFRHDP